jgi:transposase
MPKLLQARPALDAREARQVQKLATSTHAPADWIAHAQMIVRSWKGQRTRMIAAALPCHPQTVRGRLQAFNAQGLEGLGMRPGSGRKPRLSAAERSALIALARTPPPGKLVPAPDSGELQARDETKAPEWTLESCPRPRGRRASRWRAASCAASCSAKGCAGARPACGPRALIPSSPQKDADRRPLHRAPRGGDGRLRR